jgi:hypothetical protein
LVALARLSAYVDPYDLLHLPLASLTREQIRIIRDTHAHEKPNKKKKPHRGYAFVVFEREKDMRGKATSFILVRTCRSYTQRAAFRLARLVVSLETTALKLARLSTCILSHPSSPSLRRT